MPSKPRALTAGIPSTTTRSRLPSDKKQSSDPFSHPFGSVRLRLTPPWHKCRGWEKGRKASAFSPADRVVPAAKAGLPSRPPSAEQFPQLGAKPERCSCSWELDCTHSLAHVVGTQGYGTLVVCSSLFTSSFTSANGGADALPPPARIPPWSFLAAFSTPFF